MNEFVALDVLRASTFGQRTAEEEREQLKKYFVETEQWSKVFNGEIDIVYGTKGSGKSAIYNLILENEDTLFERRILVTSAENPQGAAAFQSLATDPPESEFEFVCLWKIYFLSISAQFIKDYGFIDQNAAKLIRKMEEAQLIPATFSLSRTLSYAIDYVKRLGRRVTGIEGGVNLDPATGMPTGITGKISLSEPTPAQARLGVVSIDEMLQVANSALGDTGYTLWVLLDRLDVAFADKSDLEAEALRALFKCYLDMKSLNFLKLKIFLRSDIWAKITQRGFREASHIERSLTISWKDDDILNLIARRLLSNSAITESYNVSPFDLLSDFEKQSRFFYSIFPRQVESGPNKPVTLKWLLGRTRDAASPSAPREVIHFLNELRNVEIARLERGVQPSGEQRLFSQAAFKEALPAVSRVRLQQTLYAEYPDLKPYIEKLSQQKSQQNTISLAQIWGLSGSEVHIIAKQLEEIGFFERLGTLPSIEWKVPFLYRPALDLIQGAAEG